MTKTTSTGPTRSEVTRNKESRRSNHKQKDKKIQTGKNPRINMSRDAKQDPLLRAQNRHRLSNSRARASADAAPIAVRNAGTDSVPSVARADRASIGDFLTATALTQSPGIAVAGV